MASNSIARKRPRVELIRPNEYFKAGQTMVKVYVGAEKELWIIPEDLLCDQVDFFRAALKNGFKEDLEKEIYLEEDDSAAFSYVVDWLMISGASWRGERGIKPRFPSERLADLTNDLVVCKLHVLADKLGIEHLRNAATVKFWDIVNDPILHSQFKPNQDVIDYIYDNTSEGSQLRVNLSNLAVKKFVTSNFDAQGPRGIDDWVEWTTTNSTFHLDVIKGISEHMKLHEELCEWIDEYHDDNCTIHDPLSRRYSNA